MLLITVGIDSSHLVDLSLSENYSNNGNKSDGDKEGIDPGILGIVLIIGHEEAQEIGGTSKESGKK